MDWNYVALITVVSALLLVMIQRTEPRRRRLAIGIVALCFLVIRHNAFLKSDLHEETLVAFHHCARFAVGSVLAAYRAL